VLSQFALDEHELTLLTELAHTADTMADLQRQVDKDGSLLRKDFEGPPRPHPVLVELRAQRLVYARLVKTLGLPTGLADGPVTSERSQKFNGLRPVGGA
jgi:hypothetical protein